MICTVDISTYVYSDKTAVVWYQDLGISGSSVPAAEVVLGQNFPPALRGGAPHNWKWKIDETWKHGTFVYKH